MENGTPDSPPSAYDRLIQSLSGLIDAYIALLRHELTSGATHAVSALLGGFVVVCVFAVAFFFANISIALIIGHFLGLWAGFLLVAAVYVGFSVWVLRKFKTLRKLIAQAIDIFKAD